MKKKTTGPAADKNAPAKGDDWVQEGEPKQNEEYPRGNCFQLATTRCYQATNIVTRFCVGWFCLVLINSLARSAMFA